MDGRCELLDAIAQRRSVEGRLIPILLDDGRTGVTPAADESDEGPDLERPDAKTIERIRKLIKELEKEKKRKHLSREQIIELMKKLAREESHAGEWARKWLEEWDKVEHETPSERKAGEGGLMEEPGLHKILEPEELAAGKKAHREATTRKGEHEEVGTPSGGRIDRYDPDKAHIREIKPNTPEEKKKAIEQLKRYKEEMDKKTGKNHAMELTTYDVDESGNYVWHDYIVEPDGKLRIVDQPTTHPGEPVEEIPEHGSGNEESDERIEREKKERERQEREKLEREKTFHEPRKVP